MKILILVASALAAVSAVWIPTHGEEHHPVIHNGVPIETPEVQFAKAVHLAAVEEAKAKASHDEHSYDEHSAGLEEHSLGGIEEHGFSGLEEHSFGGHQEHSFGGHQEHSFGGHEHSFEGHEQSFEGHGHSFGEQHLDSGHGFSGHSLPAYETTHVEPVIGHDGKPLDTPEVQIAKADHFAAVNKALAQTASHGYNHHSRKRRGIFEHVDEHSQDFGHEFASQDLGHEFASQDLGHDFASHDLGHDFASHDLGHSFESASLGHEEIGFSHQGSSEHSGYSIHQTHDPVYHHHESHSHHEPLFDHHGRPLDTPEVEKAKALHFHAHEEAKARLYGHGQISHEGPVDTPEVQHAKALHFAAHAAAKAQAHHH